MDREQAKKILALHRPGVTEDVDPQMTEALELVKHDPELAAWFEQQTAVFNAIRGKLKSIPVPQGLRRQIMVEHVASTRVLPLTNRMLLATAAAALVLLTAIVWSRFAPNPERSFASYRDRMASMVQRGYFMDMFEKNQGKIRAYFQSKGVPVNFTLPNNIAALPGKGAKVFTWNNHQVALLCLNKTATKQLVQNDLYVFMIDRSYLPDAPAPGKGPEFKKVSVLTTATWTAGDKVFLVAGFGDEESLRRYLD